MYSLVIFSIHLTSSDCREEISDFDTDLQNGMSVCSVVVKGRCRVRKNMKWPLSLMNYKPESRQWHPTPVLLPGKSHGQRSLVRLQSMGSLRVGHDCATSLSLFTFMHWRRNWQPAPVFLPGESQGRGSLVSCRPLGRTESDMTEAT